MIKTFAGCKGNRLNLVLLVALAFFVLFADGYTLRVRAQPGKATGGVAFGDQPQLELILPDGVSLAETFDGYVTAQIIGGPEGYENEILWYNIGSDISSDAYLGRASLTGNRRESIYSKLYRKDSSCGVLLEKGQALFSGLTINKVGVGYILRFVVYDIYDRGLVFVDSWAFDVTVGYAYQIAITSSIDTVWGGSPLESPFLVSVVDIGGNVVTDIDIGTVTCSLATAPVGGVLKPSATLSEPIFKGTAIFTTITIDLAGDGYMLNCITDLNLFGPKVVQSKTFSVVIGPPQILSFINDPFPSGITIQTGSPFVLQPRIGVYDLGRNLIGTDLTNGVLVGIAPGQAGIEIGPESRIFQIFDNGIATFSGLYLKGKGRAVSLLFTYYTYDPQRCAHNSTNLNVTTDFITLSAGRPVGLEIYQAIDGSWAGGRGFKSQPHISLMDASNVISSSDATSIIKVSLTESLSINHRLTIDTSNDPLVSISKVSTMIDSGVYGIGQNIEFVFKFDAPVVIDRTSPIAGIPYIELSGVDKFGSILTGVLVLPKVSLGTVSEPSEALYFSYIVEDGDTLNLPNLAINGNYSLIQNNSAVLDLLMRPVNTTISFSIPDTNISISTSAPYIVQIYTTLADGVYGPGHIIPFSVEFSFPVSIQANFDISLVQFEQMAPQLPLDLGGSNTANALYTHGNGTCILNFEYIVQTTDVNTPTSQVISPHRGIGSLYLPVFTSNNGSLLQLEVMQNSSNPTFLCDLSYLSALLMIGSSITINADTVFITGVNSLSPDGIYVVGDKITLSVEFSQPISTQGDIQIYLNSGGQGTFVSGGNDGISTNLTFIYMVHFGDATLNLDIASVSISLGGWIRRYASIPTISADIDIASIALLSTSTLIVVDSTKPFVVSVIPTHASPSASFHADDTVELVVTFSKPISVIGPEIPVIVLQVTSMMTREAIFTYQPSANKLAFNYKVQLGDSTSQLGMRYYPSPLCHAGGCPLNIPLGGITESTLQGGKGQLADLSVNNNFGSRMYGTPIGPPNTIILLSNRDSTIKSITTGTPPGWYGIGDRIRIAIEFSDEILLKGSSSSSLLLKNGGYAVLTEGIGTAILIYVYTITTNSIKDWSLDFDLTQGMLICSPVDSSCGLTNRVGGNVDISVTTGFQTNPAIKVDATRIPEIQWIIAEKEANAYESFFSAGEEIYFVVGFDLPVHVIGTPTVLMNTGLFSVYVNSTSTNITFLYTVSKEDLTSGLTWHNTTALYANNPLDSSIYILRDGEKPSIEANLTLPNPTALRDSKNNLIQLDGTNTPKIISINCTNPDGIYHPGDVLIIILSFNYHVSVTGKPALRLRVKSSYFEGESVLASYIPSSTISTFVTFEYIIMPGDVAMSLEVTDSNALEFGYYEAVDGNWYQSSLRSVITAPVFEGIPTLSVNRVLPFIPGSVGSLSYGRNVVIDGLIPYITSISTPNLDGTYGGKNIIRIHVTFNKEVVVEPDIHTGNVPILLLETGMIDREAVYFNGSGTSTLEFQYTVVTGDSCFLLDYWCNDSDWRNAEGTLSLRGGQVKKYSSYPTAIADLHLNPPGGVLQGTLDSTSKEGVAEFTGLFVRKRGKKYRAWFSGALGLEGFLAQLYCDFDVGFSVEFELFPDNPDAGDRFGSSLHIDSDLIVVGAPGKHLDQPAVQIIRVAGTGKELIPEVQLIATATQTRFEIQQFSTFAAVGYSVGGSWALTYPGLGTTGLIPAAASSEQVYQILLTDLPSLGRMTVTREAYMYCGCDDGYTWTLTFENIAGDVSTMEVDVRYLTGVNVGATPVVVLQESPFLGGTFRLGYMGWAQKLNESQANVTEPIPFNATASQLKSAIETGLGILVSNVEVECCEEDLGQKWSITFNNDNGDYNIAPLTTDVSGLTGYGAYIWHVNGQDGQGPVLGNFRVRFLNSSWSSYLSIDSSAFDVESALLALESIENVTVTRKDGVSAGIYSWYVTFYAVRQYTLYGFESIPMGVLPHIDIDLEYVRGSQNGVTVSATTGGIADYAPWEGKKMGSAGEDAGAVYIFEQVENTVGSEASEWVLISSLIGSDTNVNDEFGHAVYVSKEDNLLIVGAPYSEDFGVVEIQKLECINGGATDGYFTLSFRGFQTPDIPYNATLSDLYYAIRGPFGTTLNLHSIPEIEIQYENVIDEWSGYGFCENGGNAAILTFRVPQHGIEGGLNSDIELLEVDNSNLIGNGRIIAVEVQKGTANPSGPMSKGEQTGAAYVFRFNGYIWEEEQKLFPSEGSGTDRFGWSVAFQKYSASKMYILIGAPGQNQERGAVHVYTFNGLNWYLFQVLTTEPFSTDTDQFGSALSGSANTVAISAPGYRNNSGAVDIWVLSWGGVYQAFQRILPPTSYLPDDQFGYSISLLENLLVVGCPGCSDTWQHTGRTRTTETGSRTGSVFLYQRVDWESKFELFQVLNASNVKPGDQLGHSVSASLGVIIVSSLESHQPEDIKYQRSVQTVTTNPKNVTINSSFRLGWKKICSNNTCKTNWSSSIPADSGADEIKIILEQSFGFGKDGNSELLVTRSGVDPMTCGYKYTIVFLGEEGNVPILEVDYGNMKGKGATVTVEVVNEVPSAVRGVVHVFQRVNQTDMAENFKEQCFLYPYVKQRQDLYGKSAILRWPFVVIGAPNRDISMGSLSSETLIDVNSGSATVFTIDFLDVRFDSNFYEVLEGKEAYLNLSRQSTSSVQVFFVKTLDRNSVPPFSTYAASVYDLSMNPPDIPLDKTSLDVIGVGSAIAGFKQTSQKENLWINGVFDYRGISDYLPIEIPLLFDVGKSKITQVLYTNNDNIIEVPDEFFSVAIYLPGMFPSLLGDLITTVFIVDDNDGEGPTGSGTAEKGWETYDATPILPSYSDARMYSHKISSDETRLNSKFGLKMDSDREGNWVIVGDSFTPCSGPNEEEYINCGVAYLYKLELGVWVREFVIQNPIPKVNSEFGSCVKINQVYGQNDTFALVSSPGEGIGYIYKYDMPTDTWTLHQNLTMSSSNNETYQFGKFCELGDNIAAISAPQLETVFLFYRKWVNISLFEWSKYPDDLLVSPYQDFDFILNEKYLHLQEFGVSIALDASGRTLAVGSPLADYELDGVNSVENGRTNTFERARGRVYIFYRTPPTQTITLATQKGVSTGSFHLVFSHQNITSISSSPIPWNSSAENLQNVLEQFDNIDRIKVDSYVEVDPDTGNTFRHWTVMFVGEWFESPFLFEVLIEGDLGCEDCEPFNVPPSLEYSTYLSIIYSANNEPWEVLEILEPDDRGIGDRFGSSLAIDGETLAVGADSSAGIASTTWDFETGDLTGWVSTGTAFKNQPTFGDNSYFRETYGSPARHSNLQGRYYIGTFENRPGLGKLDYLNPDPNFLPGSILGDESKGILTSDIFEINGNDISLLIGGGCDYSAVYVSLSVDSIEVIRTTGQCNEKMTLVQWDVGMYLGRMGRITVVDDSSETWGHISVDNIQFSWENRGGTTTGSSLTLGTLDENGSIKHYSLKKETPLSGAVYMFVQMQISNPQEYCHSGLNRKQCMWYLQTKLVASDKRAGDKFGTSISLDHSTGVVAVGSPHAMLTGFWLDIPSIYSTSEPYGYDLELTAFSSSPELASLLRVKGAYGSIKQPGSGGPLIWPENVLNLSSSTVLGNSNVGAVYFFKRNLVDNEQIWSPIEHMKLQPHDGTAGDSFGYSVLLIHQNRQLLIGSPNSDSFGSGFGTIYQYDTGIIYAKFEKTEISVLEGNWRGLTSKFEPLSMHKAEIKVLRSNSYINEWLTIEFATSDLTALGVSSETYLTCIEKPVDQRVPLTCGDYERTAGRVTFQPGQKEAFFYVRIMDDLCEELFPEYIQLTLSIPGSAAIIGGKHQAKIRIDDNDVGLKKC